MGRFLLDTHIFLWLIQGDLQSKSCSITKFDNGLISFLFSR